MIEITLRIDRGEFKDIFGIVVKKKGDILQEVSNLQRKYNTRLEGAKIKLVKGTKSVTIDAMASGDDIIEASKKL